MPAGALLTYAQRVSACRVHLATSAGPGKARPGELWLRGARRRIGLDPERASCRRDKSRIHDCILRGALIAGHEGCSPALDERLVGAIGLCVAVRVMGRDVARLHNYDPKARGERPAFWGRLSVVSGRARRGPPTEAAGRLLPEAGAGLV